MLPGSTLFCTKAFSKSSIESSSTASLSGSGVMRSSRSSTPVTSTMATSGNCSIRLLMTFSANSHKSRKAFSSVVR